MDLRRNILILYTNRAVHEWKHADFQINIQVMRKLKLYIAASLDGFIATPDGSVTWLEEAASSKDPNAYGYQSFLDSIDTTIMGYNTYKFMEDLDAPFPYPDKKNFVFSSSHQKAKANPAIFVATDLVEFTRDLKKENGQDIWLIGGGKINAKLLNAGLIDEFIITYVPIVLGSGIPLFAENTTMTSLVRKLLIPFDDGLFQVILEKKA